MLLLRRVKLRLAQRAGLKRQVNLVKPVAASIARAVVKAAAGSVSISRTCTVQDTSVAIKLGRY